MSHHIHGLLDYADELKRMAPDSLANELNHFMALIFIERILDTYGRSEVRADVLEQTDDEQQAHDAMVDVTRRMDELRMFIRSTIQEQGINERVSRSLTALEMRWRN